MYPSTKNKVRMRSNKSIRNVVLFSTEQNCAAYFVKKSFYRAEHQEKPIPVERKNVAGRNFQRRKIAAVERKKCFYRKILN